MSLTPALFAVGLCTALFARAQAPLPVCPHQLTPIVSSVISPTLPENCNSTSTPPHTKSSNLIASENFQGIVFAYSGASQNCPGNPFSADIMTLTGECGGASAQGQPVVCAPILYSDVATAQHPAVSAMLVFSFYAETEPNTAQPDVGPFSCDKMGTMQGPTGNLSAANCPCPCSTGGSTALTFNPASPILAGAYTTIIPPSGFKIRPGNLELHLVGHSRRVRH